MNKTTTTLLLLAISCNILIAQTINQSKLLAAHHIKEKRTYSLKCNNGQPNGDTILTTTALYNAAGYLISEVKFDTVGRVTLKEVHEYLHDSIILKVLFLKNDTAILSEHTHLYDSAGNHVQNINHFLTHSKSRPDTDLYFIIYDDHNRQIESYHDEGKGKKYGSKYEYDARGNMVKRTSYSAVNKVPNSEELVYDARGNIIQSSQLDGKKRWLIQNNTYNALNQWVEKRTVYEHKVKKHFYSLEFKVKKTSENLAKYFYDSSGFLIREERYARFKLVGISLYQYFQ